MSNTSSLTPYNSEGGRSESAIGLAGACIAGVFVGGVSLVKWLSEETGQDRAIRDRLNEDQRSERLRHVDNTDLSCALAPSAFSVKTVNLNIRELEPLVRAAQKLGYRPETINHSKFSGGSVFLESAKGERMVITSSSEGRLTLGTAGDAQRVKNLVRQHTLDRTMEHLKVRQDLDIQTVELTNGDVQIMAKNKGTQRRSSVASIKTQVNRDGTLWVDVEKVKGNRCEQIVNELAQAVGARVSHMRKKDSYFQLPGEPVFLKVEA